MNADLRPLAPSTKRSAGSLEQVATIATPWRNRIVGQGEELPDQLLANPRNWRTHPGAQRDALRGSLSEVGWVQQILVNRTTGHVVDGHARVEEAISAGAPTVPVLYVELSEAEERLVLATLDPIGAMAEADSVRLDELLAELNANDPGLQALLDSLATPEPKVGLTDPDDVPALAETTIKAGDLFALGDHRLLCGDAIDPAGVARLLDGATPTDTMERWCVDGVADHIGRAVVEAPRAAQPANSSRRGLLVRQPGTSRCPIPRSRHQSDR